MKFNDRMALEGIAKLGIADGKAMLESLLESGAPDEVAKDYNCTVQTVYRWMREWSIPRSRMLVPFDELLKENGYKSADDFFMKHYTETQTQMSDRLGCTTATINKYYQMFLERQGIREPKNDFPEDNVDEDDDIDSVRPENTGSII